MIDAICNLLFPSICLYCYESMETRHLLCSNCLVGFELLSVKGRCRRCFSSKFRKGKCESCIHYPPWYYKRGALFEKGSSEEVWVKDPDQYAKLIAAFSVIQIDALEWPPFEGVIGEKGFDQVAHEMRKFLQIKNPRCFEGKNLLLMTKSDSDTLIDEVPRGTKLFILSALF